MHVSTNSGISAASPFESLKHDPCFVLKPSVLKRLQKCHRRKKKECVKTLVLNKQSVGIN